MTSEQRKKEVLKYVSESEFRTLKEITNQFNISINTARRDINELAEQNLLQKFYGGVKATEKKQSSKYTARMNKNSQEKWRIAKFAAGLIQDNDILFIDAGTTTSGITDFINKSFHLTFVTNNIHVMSKVMEVENWDMIVVGSKLKHSSHSLIDIHDWDYLHTLNLNKSFIATTGLTIHSGATNPDHGDAVIKSTMIKQSQESYLLLDFSKFDQTSLSTFAHITDFNRIITDSHVPKQYKEYCKEHEITLDIV